ncbi:MAG: hypothetical protein WAM14_09935, partial [Candidatus Nitrosopolaris sp.]
VEYGACGLRTNLKFVDIIGRILSSTITERQIIVHVVLDARYKYRLILLKKILRLSGSVRVTHVLSLSKGPTTFYFIILCSRSYW